MNERLRIGIDLGGSKIEIIALDPSGVALLRRRVTSPAHDYEAVVETIGALVDEAEHDLGEHCSVGVGTPGAASRREGANGAMKNANSTALIGRPLARDLARRLRRDVRIENDANCFALSEAVDGAAAGERCVLGVILGTGVGSGIVIDGRVLSGCNAIAGEWGHNPLPWATVLERPGPACYCGKHGCTETFLSGPGLARDFARDADPAAAPLAVPGIVAAAGGGDARAAAALERYYDRLARAIAAVVNVLDPDAIVLGGGVSNVAALYEELPRRLGAYVFSDTVDTRILRPCHGDSSGVRGAAWLWPAIANGIFHG